MSVPERRTRTLVRPYGELSVIGAEMRAIPRLEPSVAALSIWEMLFDCNLGLTMGL